MITIEKITEIGAGFRVLIACEESDEVRGRFEALGFDAWSCDLQPNRNPNAKHYQGSVFEIINDNWDAMIAFPPCTHLAACSHIISINLNIN